MQEEKFSPQDSLRLIQAMILRTKNDLSGNSKYFLLWGWLTFFACTAQFILKHFYQYEKHYQVWFILVIGIAGSIYFAIKDGKRSTARTYVGDSMSYLWMGMGITFFVLSMILTKLGWNSTVFPFFIMLYALGTFVSGKILQFKPMAIGGIVAWLLAVGCVYASYDYQMLFAAGAILVSYIIPAYILRMRTHSKQ
jgi:hypothetical protein